MRIYVRSLLVLVLTATIAGATSAAEQQDRRGRAEPGLIVETGARMGTCDVLTFTADGKHLLAAGDDKVVRVWPVTAAGIDAARVRTLRWSIWHEQRGNIYALALDPSERLIAVGGRGVMTGMVTVLDWETGRVAQTLTDPNGNDQAVRALAFSPSGRRLAIGTDAGGVWLWDLEGRANDVRRLGKLAPGRDDNQVRLLVFENESSLISAARDGRVLVWDANRPDTPPTERFRFFASQPKPNVYRVVQSRDGKWLAAGGWHRHVEVRSLDGQQRRDDIVLSRRTQFPTRVARSLAFDPSGDRLAVGIRSVDVNDFFHGTDDEITLYTLGTQPPSRTPGARCAYHAEALAFHPDGMRLALAGGDDHEVTLWEPGTGRSLGASVQGPGRCLWGVGLSADRRYLGFQDRRANRPGVNRRGSGPWRVFDLGKRTWLPAGADFRPVPVSDSAGGWRVTFPPENVFQWSIVAPVGTAYPLHFDEKAGGLPLCYTFLPAGGGRPVRLAVGQYFGGVSLFELGENTPRDWGMSDRVKPARFYTAHQGEVMALAPSADGRWLLTASRDQTIAALSLDDWPAGNELAARFEVRDDKLYVDKVDTGGPAWEAGLLEGDEIRLLALGGQPVYYRTDEHGGQKASPTAGLAALRSPTPGEELVLHLRRVGRSDLVSTNTLLRRRPQWRFFPTAEREWVLWLWRGYYYDTSTNGDSLIGWHVNQGDRLEQQPAFHPAAKFRSVFQRPALLDRMLWEPQVEARLGTLVRIRPPEVGVRQVGAAKTNGAAVCVKVLARAQDGTNPDQQLSRAELWVEDHRFAQWQVSGCKEFVEEVFVPVSKLRAGPNQITFQCFNVAGGSEEATLEVSGPNRDGPPDLHGLVVGIGDYRQAHVPGGRPENLKHTVADAQAIRDAWQRQAGKRFRHATLSALVNQDASRQAILDHLHGLASRVRTDDLFVLFLGGHGYAQPATASAGADRFVFCCPHFDIDRPEATGLASQALYEALAALPCRKLVLLDVCHAGMAANPVRGLTPGGKGPTILASCDKTEAAVEDDTLKHGLFTYALMEALGQAFDRADSDHDGKLDAEELFHYTEERLPQLLQELKRNTSQNPTRFPQKPDHFPLAVK
jgi:WD40 repeat protein